VASEAMRGNSGRSSGKEEDGKPLPPRLPSEASANVFLAGLRTCRLAYLPDFPSLGLSVESAFVPAHRCGAVPDSHRIPFSSSLWRNQGIEPLYIGIYPTSNHIGWVWPAHPLGVQATTQSRSTKWPGFLQKLESGDRGERWTEIDNQNGYLARGHFLTKQTASLPAARCPGFRWELEENEQF
jgi:hypothetical protein